MIEIKSGKTVIIFDIHQNIAYAEKCLSEDADHYLFIGDYFDTRVDIDGKKIFGFEATCEWLNRKFYELGDKAVWLLGNHDLAYIASYNKTFKRAKLNPYYNCTGVTNSKVKQFSKYINPKWFQQLKLCAKVGDFYCVHAGFQSQHFKPHFSLEENINSLYNQWEKDKHQFQVKPFHWIWNISKNRGGDSQIGSPIWVDFHYEFEPIEDLNQIVGHTQEYKFRIKYSNNSKNYCGDAGQTCYAIWKNNKINFVYL